MWAPARRSEGDWEMKNTSKRIMTALAFAVLASLPVIAMAGMTASQR